MPKFMYRASLISFDKDIIKSIYQIRGKITECWLAETEGIFS